MKVLFLCNKFPYPLKDGGAIATFNLIRSFSKLGHQVTVLAMNTSKHRVDTAGLPRAVSSLARFIAVDVDNRVNLFAAAWNLLLNRSYNVQRFVSVPYNDKLIGLLHEEEFDLVQLEGLYLSLYVETVRAFSSAKISMRAHNVEHLIWKRMAETESSFAKRAYLSVLASQLKTYERERVNKYDLVVPISDADAKLFAGMQCDLPMHVCPASFDANVLHPAPLPAQPSLFFIGALDWMPNLEGLNWFLRQVWGKLHLEFPQLTLHIAGRNTPGHIRSLEGKDNIHVAGEVEEAHTFMRSQGIMIVPLLSGSGMRVKIIEAMAMGKPIVSTTVGAEGIGAEHGKHILLADQPEEFAAAIRKLMAEETFRSALGDQGAELARSKYEATKTAIDLLSFYNTHLHS